MPILAYLKPNAITIGLSQNNEILEINLPTLNAKKKYFIMNEFFTQCNKNGLAYPMSEYKISLLSLTFRTKTDSLELRPAICHVLYYFLTNNALLFKLCP
jgi:hypothetical protein